ncbi:MAG: SPOR domain-containing protein [Hyphomicrobiales bacterium]|nr:SPOR domain-containing protein [Hyphomicrobiales bacterium]
MSIFATLKRGGRWPAVIGTCALAVFTVLAFANPAEAARKKKFRGGYTPPYAAMVIDAKTGRTLHAVNENALRHPASITKVMTLYMLFEQMERGRFSMTSPLRVSSYAAARPPSKLGLKAGETIDVEDAIMALITKSANDVAVVVAENVAGDEETFAEQMTRRARSLGMSRTVFRNASGLPDAEQVTTARDLTILARAIQERFPRQYHLFQARNFEYAGRNHRNHNKLLGRVEGVDGIKTGYTRNSGFNLMTSAKADGRHIVSIVLGGRSGSSRDQIMANLVVAHLPRAATGPRTSLVAQLPETEREAEPVRREPAAAERSRMTVAAAEPVRPAAREVPVAAAPAIRPAARPLDLAQVRPVVASTTAQAFAAPTPTSTSAPAMRWSAGASAAIAGREIRPPAPVAKVDAPKIIVEPAQRQQVQVASAQPVRPAPVVAPPVAIEQQPSRAAAPRPPANVQVTSSIAKAPEKAQAPVSGWVIQLGATDDEGKAKGIISNAKAKARSLADARGFTETVERGGATLFRARFAGFDDQSDANNACRDLKRNGFSCFATRG